MIETSNARDLEPLLAVAAKLAAPFDLRTMLVEVVDAAKQVLRAERGTLWLYDAERDELALEVSTDIAGTRLAAGTGLVGTCARTRRAINVPDCYADARFDRAMDLRTGYRTRCMLTLPLIDHKDVLVGVMQVLNKEGGVFDAADESLANVLAAQCAVALQRCRMTEALIEGERMRQSLEMARVVQMGTLPASMPQVPGYDVFGMVVPAELTGGDTFDLEMIGQGLLVVLGDATGHGIAPALSITQMQAMLRIAFRLGADLDTAFREVNNQLEEMLPNDRFITAFVGLLDPRAHRLRFHSGGQGPILHYRAAAGSCACHGPTSFPLAAMPLAQVPPPVAIDMRPGDILVLLSDGVYEHPDARNVPFGEERVRELVAAGHDAPMAELARRLLEAVREHGPAGVEADDITIVLVKRAGTPGAEADFPRGLGSLEAIFAFSREACARLGVDSSLLPTIDLALEELFTNVTKYGKGDGAVKISLDKIDGGAEVTVIEPDAEPFDVAAAPDVDVGRPISERSPGGLGLHLVRRMVDRVEYTYLPEAREGRVRFTKTTKGPDDARD